MVELLRAQDLESHRHGYKSYLQSSLGKNLFYDSTSSTLKED